MSEKETTGAKADAEMPAYIIEAARSGRAKCKTCRKPIAKDALRLGVMVEGPFGYGHMWYHLVCAAKRLFDRLEEAYAQKAWENAKDVPEDIPPLEVLAVLKVEADKKRAEKRNLPYVELDPSGRARCKHCDELIERGSVRVVIGRSVEFGQQIRTTPINIHPGCAADALQSPDSTTEPDSLADDLRENSKGVDSELLDAVIHEIGSLY